MFQFDPQRSGVQNSRIQLGDYRECWSSPIPGVPTGSETTPLFVKGMVIVGTHSGLLMALNENDGTLNWTFETKTKLYGTPVVAEDKIYFISGDGIFFILDLSGNLILSNNLTDIPLRSPSFVLRGENIIRKRLGLVTKKFSIGSVRNWASLNYFKGKLYAMVAGRGLLCLNLQGHIEWERPLGSVDTFYLCGVAIVHTNIYAIGSKRRLHCFSHKGQLNWVTRVSRFGDIWSNPSIDIDAESIYLGTDINQSKGRVVCVGFNGRIKWKSSIIQAVRGSIVKGDHDQLYVCGLAGIIYILNARNGQIIKKIRVSKDSRALWTSPTIDADRNILVSVKINRSEGGIVKLYKGNLYWLYRGAKILATPSINTEGAIFFGAWDSTIKKLQPVCPV